MREYIEMVRAYFKRRDNERNKGNRSSKFEGNKE